MRVKKINNTSEIYTYNELSKGLEGIEAMIFPKLPIADVVDSEIRKILSKKAKNLFDNSHFDFIVTNKNHIPLFAVEFDGPFHELYDKKRINDIRKNRICQLAELPLIRVTDLQLQSFDSISVLRFIAYRYVKWTNDYPKIHQEWEKELSEMSEDELEAITSEGYLSPPYDPHFRFDIKHPFPLRDEVIEKLVNKHHLYNFITINNRDSFWYSVFPGGDRSMDGIFTSSYHYGIYKGNESNSNISWKEGRLETKGVNILKEEKIEFGMKWALITAEDFNNDTAPFLYEQQNGFLPIYHPDLPGSYIPSICRSIAEYISYKRLLQFVEENNIMNNT